MDKRIFVEKKKGYRIKANELYSELRENLHIKDLKGLRLLNAYDVFDIDSDVLEKAKSHVFAETVTDDVFESVDFSKNYFAVEYHPGQFDQRADSAMQCIKLLRFESIAKVRSGQLFILEGDISNDDLAAIKKYMINDVEAREKDLSVLEYEKDNIASDVPVFEGFIGLCEQGVRDFAKSHGFAMSDEDLLSIHAYFKDIEKRDPTETEILVLDTYWSDHCRHTTFETMLSDIKIEKSQFSNSIQTTFETYLALRKTVHGDKDKPMTLMDMATICAKYERKMGNLDDMEISEEINACSVYVDVDVDGETEKWLLMFKNETHNHPTEIEPFGGASTCIGGAIRDPLSGRSFVYQAMRISGAADTCEDIEKTTDGKLSQKKISKGASDGNSSYGNQIGLATTYVREIQEQGYRAKHLEVGAVVGATRAENVRRESPVKGDLIILVGGRTGRDGIGGATGSSKEHDSRSIETASAEVQKGNAPTERKLQRLLRKKEVAQLIKKSNDFGAGGVCVAIGEISDSLEISLDDVPLKYSGLTGTEIAISESQERMAVVVEPSDVKKFISESEKENLEAVKVAVVTDTGRLKMTYRGKVVVDLKRSFIDTNGVRQKNDVIIGAVRDVSFKRNYDGRDSKEKYQAMLKSKNVAMQKGMVEMFDSTVGATTVLMPYGGKTQLTKSPASVQMIPVLDGKTNTASVLAYGYNPDISMQSPYHGAAYAVVESLARVVSTGASYKNVRFSFQEYFEKLGVDEKRWGKPLAALLGSIYVQNGFNLPAIGGKDSMSGSFNDLDVPPTLISFAVTTVDANNVISAEFKAGGNDVYLINHTPNSEMMPNIDMLKENYDFVTKNIENKTIVSAYPIEFGGVGEAIAKMSIGNMIGFEGKCENLYDVNVGSILVESKGPLDFENAILIGKTVDNAKVNQLKINDIQISLYDVTQNLLSTYEKIYPVYAQKKSALSKEKTAACINNAVENKISLNPKKTAKPKVVIPVFPGTNCEYESKIAFERAGADVSNIVFKNQTEKDILASIDTLSEQIDSSDILMLAGGFSAGDEPDGSGKFIANVLENEKIKSAVHGLISRDGLIIGICNGFQALVKSGLLPYGQIRSLDEKSPTLFTNTLNRHISCMATTKITNTSSPWLSSFTVGDMHKIAISHGEGRFICDDEMRDELFENGQVFSQYCDSNGNASLDGDVNVNGSTCAIEGIVSKCGKIIGKMGHSERKGEHLYKNIYGDKTQDPFENAVKYFTEE
jgi:phosphoribosylformylglycinamidine synthase